jgi:hypothetical protein
MSLPAETWFGAQTFVMGGRSKVSRPIENNTRIEQRGDDYAVVLHGTDVVTYHKDGSVTLDSGGWLTVTTKDRMNGYLGTRARVWSERGKWFVGRWDGTRARTRFFDGITIASDGTVLNPPDPSLEQRKAEAEAKMRKRIDKFVDGYIAQLADGMPVPSGGDCWGCSMFGDHDTSHLLDHLTENYFVPTMLWNAMKDRGYRDVSTTMGIFLDYEAYNTGVMRVRRAWHSEEADKNTLKDFRRALGKYLRKRLITTVAV